MDTNHKTMDAYEQYCYNEKLERLIEDVNTHGIIFNFQDEHGKMKTGIIRKGQFDPTVFKNGWIPEYRKMTRKERRSL